MRVSKKYWFGIIQEKFIWEVGKKLTMDRGRK